MNRTTLCTGVYGGQRGVSVNPYVTNSCMFIHTTRCSCLCLSFAINEHRRLVYIVIMLISYMFIH